MANLSRKIDFTVNVLQPLRILNESLRQELHRNRVPEFQIVGTVDFASHLC